MNYKKILKLSDYYYLITNSNYRQDPRQNPQYQQDVVPSDPVIEEESEYSFSRGLQAKDLFTINSIEYNGYNYNSREPRDKELAIKFSYKDPKIDYSEDNLEVNCTTNSVKSIDYNKCTSGQIKAAKAGVASTIAQAVLNKMESFLNDNESSWWYEENYPLPKKDINNINFNKTLIAYQKYILDEYNDKLHDIVIYNDPARDY